MKNRVLRPWEKCSRPPLQVFNAQVLEENEELRRLLANGAVEA